MITPSPALFAALYATENQPVDLYELYLDAGTFYFADVDLTWGGHHYLPYVESRSTIERIEGPEFDRVSVTLSNVDTQIAQIVLSASIEGRRIIIRKIDRTVGADSIVLFNGRMQRPSKINEKTAIIEAYELLGSIQHEIPARTFSLFCGLKFKGEECSYVGPEDECPKSWAACTGFANTPRFGGFRFIPHSGTFQYQQTETKRFLGIFPRKKTRTITASFNSVDDTPYGVAIPIVLGRAQMQGLVIQHADEGENTQVLAAMCTGPIERFTFVRANQVAVPGFTTHIGQFGGEGSQTVDPRFPNSYPYNLLAYLGTTIPSSVTEVDPAPTITGVVHGWKVERFDTNGTFIGFDWTDNAAFNARALLVKPLAQGGMGVPLEEIDDAVTGQTAVYTDEAINDPTGGQKIFVPLSLPEDVRLGQDYKRFRSTCVIGSDPAIDGPYEAFEPGVNDDTTVPALVPVKRFTVNCAIAKQGKAIDIFWKKILGAFRGFITYGQHGKIQIRAERPVANTKLSGGVSAGVTSINVLSGTPFSAGQLVLIGALTVNAEVGTVQSSAAGSITLTGPTTKAHASGDVVHFIHAAYDDRNLIGTVQFPLEDRQQETNRVSVKYIDAPGGFEEQTAEINDYEHQEKNHKVNNLDYDGSAIDSYFQAWRIGQWRLAKARDLGQFVEMRTDIRGTLHEVGDVIVVSAVECGLSCAPFRVIQVGFEADDEVTLVGQVYDLGVYDDLAPRATARVPAVFKNGVPTSPQPEIWHPNSEQPAIGDPLYGRDERKFAQFQNFEPQPGGGDVLTLTAYGDVPPNAYIAIAPPVMPQATVATTGGTIIGGKRYFFRVHAQLADKRLSPPSSTIAVDVPAGTNTNRITFSGIVWPSGAWANAVLVGSDDLETMCVQATPAIASSIIFATKLERSTWGIPGPRLLRVRSRTKRVGHAGVAGATINAVDSTSITCTALVDEDDIDDWNGRFVSILSDKSDGSAALWNFTCTAYDKTTGKFTVTPDPEAAGVEAGDVLIVDATATAAGPTSITDNGFSNKYSRAGLNPDEERGCLVRITSGTGRYQIRRILDVTNSGRTLVLDRPWDVVPIGATFIIEDAAWAATADSAAIRQEVPSSQMTIRASLDLLQRKVVLQQVFTVDVNGRESSEEKSPFRLTYLYALADLDDTVPPDPGFGLGATAGRVEFGGLGFLTLENTRTISAATFTLYYADEAAPTTTTLSGAISNSATSLTGSSLAAFQEGDLVLIDGEIIKLESITGDTAAIARAQKESTAAAHADTVKIWRLEKRVFIFHFPRFFFGTPASGAWGPMEPFPSKAIAAADLYVTNFRGDSNTVTRNFSSAIVDGRTRTLSGKQVEIVVDGVFGIESDAVPETRLRETASFGTIYAQVNGAPVGADIVVVLKVDNVDFATLTIPAGDTISNLVEGRDVAFVSIPADVPITIDITQVGSTFPGERLIVRIVM